MKQPSFSGLTLSRFCFQISMLLKSATPLPEGLLLMAKDSSNLEQTNILSNMSKQLEEGLPFSQVMKESHAFPSYVLHMTLLGEQTGTLDITMERLSEYYEQEHIIYENLRRAITSPMIMLTMLMAILFILFTKVMPLFTGVYTQLGASIPKIATVAIKVGGFLSGVAFVISILLLLMLLFLWIQSEQKKENFLFQKLLTIIKTHSSLFNIIALHRFCSVMVTAYPCGIDLKSSFTLAQEVVEHPDVENKLKLCTLQLEEGKNFSEVVESANLFSDFDLQMIRTGTRTGQLEAVLRYLDSDYNRRSYDIIQNFISRLEPTIILVLAIATGMVLLSVMLPLVGILSSIG